MLESMLTPGTMVRASYKTGDYIGEVVELSPTGKVAVKIAAVVKHPTQGDLHNPMDPDVAFFHQRRALAYQEIALMPPNTVRPHHGTVPDYRESLRQALVQEREQLKRTVRWAERCLEELDRLEGEYA
ncbi:kinase-associated lipoprotein B [Paenibacillus elgii]|uniref:kinase-associated lipoprotein B n=1 Tax=Paenibacillus elgii TaxID=189691 RepID=UPI0002DAA868|nr:kinase-associated lipoprotein B [Paenibacillus elgii]